MSFDDKSLFYRTTSPAQLMVGFQRVRKNGGMAGGDGQTIKQFTRNISSRLKLLSKAVQDGKYQPSPYRSFEKQKKSGGKRLLRVPSVRDRVLMSAVTQLLMQKAEGQFENVNFGYRPGRSVQQALKAVQAHRANGFTHVAEADLDDFFDMVPHHAVLTAFDRFFSDDRLRALVELWLSHAEPDGRGLAQGSPLSPLLANCYLDQFDELMAEMPVKLVRYADDFLLLARTEEAATKGLTTAEEFFKTHGLTFHPDKTRLVPMDDEFTFLGASFSPDDGTGDLSEFEEVVLEPDLLVPPDATVEKDFVEEKENTRPDLQTLPRPHRFAVRVRTLYIMRSCMVTARGQQYVIKSPLGEAKVAAGEFDRIEVAPQGHLDSKALALAVENDVAVVLTDGFGLEKARLSGTSSLAHERHLNQAALRQDASTSSSVVCALVYARIHNQRALLRRLNYRRKNINVAETATILNRVLRKLDPAKALIS